MHIQCTKTKLHQVHITNTYSESDRSLQLTLYCIICKCISPLVEWCVIML